MGWNGYQINEVEYVEIIGHYKRIAGKCPMCGKEFDITFDLKNGQIDYKCICGYFNFDAESDRFTEDNHHIPKEEWIKRRQDKEAELTASKSEPDINGLQFQIKVGYTCRTYSLASELCTDQQHRICQRYSKCCKNCCADFSECQRVRRSNICEAIPEED